MDGCCEEVRPEELPQLLRQLKSVMTPTTPATPRPSAPTPITLMKTEPMEEEEAQHLVAIAGLEVGASGSIGTPIMIKLGPHLYQFSVGTVTLPQRQQNMPWMHTSVVPIARRLSCVPSVILVRTIWIHSRDMRRSTSRIFLVLLSLGSCHFWGLNYFIFFNAHFLSVNIFTKGGGL